MIVDKQWVQSVAFFRFFVLCFASVLRMCSMRARDLMVDIGSSLLLSTAMPPPLLFFTTLSSRDSFLCEMFPCFI